MLMHIKIRLGRIKGLKGLFLRSLFENGLRSPGDKGR